MTEAVEIALIAGAGPFLISCVTAFLQLRHGWKVKEVEQKIDRVGVLAERTEKNTNSMKDELVAVSRSDATQIERARGMAAATSLNEAAKQQLVERRRQPMIPLVAVPVESHETVETHYVIRGGQLVTLSPEKR